MYPIILGCAKNIFKSKVQTRKFQVGIMFFSKTRFNWIGLKPQLFGSVIKMSKLIFATLAF